MKELNAPAFTYASPSRAVRSVEKMAVSHGGMNVRFVISKDGNGRYFPVFVGRLSKAAAARLGVVGGDEEEVTRQRRQNKPAKKASARKPAKKAAKKAVKRTTRSKKTLH